MSVLRRKAGSAFQYGNARRVGLADAEDGRVGPERNTRVVRLAGAILPQSVCSTREAGEAVRVAIQVLCLVSMVVGCNPSDGADPGADGGDAASDGACDPQPELEVCAPSVVPTAEHVAGPGHDLAPGTAIDAAWERVEAGGAPATTTLVLLEAGAERLVSVAADARPLVPLLSMGEAVRLEATDSGLRLTRVADGALLLAVVSYSLNYGGPTTPEAPDGFGAALEKRAFCDLRNTAFPLCRPVLLRAFALDATGADGPVTAEPGETVRVRTASGAFDLSNGMISEEAFTATSLCGCAIGVPSNVRFAVVRAE
jgi:hypothetical protein